MPLHSLCRVWHIRQIVGRVSIRIQVLFGTESRHTEVGKNLFGMIAGFWECSKTDDGWRIFQTTHCRKTEANRCGTWSFPGAAFGLYRTGTITDVNKASVPGWPKVVVSRHPAYRAAQYDEAQEAQPAKGRFQKAACFVEDLALKARPKPG